MCKRLFIVVAGFFLVAISAKAQSENWRSSTVLKGSNYFDIVQKENNRLSRLQGRTDRKSRKQIKQFKRWASFWKDRVTRDGAFMSEAHTYNEWEKEQNRLNNSRLNRNGVSNADWSLVGPVTLPVSDIGFYPGMGRVNVVAFNGTDVNTMYVGTPSGGIWKTTDGGSSWTPKGDEFPNMGVSDIVINPTNPNILYLATGDWDGRFNRSIGVFKSVNGGDDWAPTGLTFTLGEDDIISKLLIDPNNVNTVFATTRDGIKRTIDGGANWTNVHDDFFAFFNDITYKIGSNTVLYATSKTGKFYISTNNGANWSVASSPGSSSNRLDLALTPNDPNLILTLEQNGVVRKSTNQGSTWTTVSTIPNFISQGGYNVTLAISPLNKDLVLAGGVEGWRSTNGGTSWEHYLDGYWEEGNPYFYVHSDHHDMKFIPGTNTAFSANDGGVFKGDASSDMSWADLSSGLAITTYYNVSGTPQDVGKLIMGAQDNDIAVYDGGVFTGKNPGSDGVEGLWNYSDSNIAWTCSQGGYLERTLNGFSSSNFVETPDPDNTPFIWELEIHPTAPSTIFGGFGDIHKSTNLGDTWVNLNSGVGPVEFISIAPSNADVIYVSGEINDSGDPGLVKRTTNGGALWNTITLPQAGQVKSIEVHPTNPAEVYIAYSGYETGKVYKSTNSGVTWTNITGSLPNIPTHQIRYKTGSTDGELFLATDLGVYYRSNSAGDWVKLGTGLPNVIVYDIEIHYATEKLRAATYGRGVWEIPIDDASLSTADSELPESALSLFPNPAKDKSFTIKLNNLEGETNVVIYNVIGAVVKDFKTSAIKEKVNLTSFASGLYLVKITNNNKSTIKKIVLD